MAGARAARSGRLKPLPRSFYACSPEVLARRMLGTLLVRRFDDGVTAAIRIVEAEAYLGVRDRAAHTFGGRRTARNEAMYAEPGTAYVYFTYGMHYCLNAVCGEPGEPVAVLIRAGEPVRGVERMAELRGPAARDELRLAAGPARLCQAMRIDRALNGHDLTTGEALWMTNDPDQPPPGDREVVRAARVGVDYAGPWAARRLRWLVRGSPSVSVPPRPGGGRPTRKRPPAGG